MKSVVAFLIICLLPTIAIATSGSQEPSGPVFSAELASPYCQSANNWQVLFDGSSLAEWEFVGSGVASWINTLAFWRKPSPHGGWVIDQQGLLYRGSSAGDLRSRREFANFELALEWKISEGGNSGIKLRVAEEDGEPANNGFEMQILDNENHQDGANPLTSAGALYGLYPPKQTDIAVSAGEWNQVHIRIDGTDIEFYLNGRNTVSAKIGSSDWLARLDMSPQRDRVSERFAQFEKGRILLQDHFDDVWFRNINICELQSLN